jgi:SAM-dependent methyltransferase
MSLTTTAPSLRCRACGGDDLPLCHNIPSSPRAKAIEYRACEKCGTIIDASSSAPDYVDDCSTASFDLAWRYYLECGAGVHFMASTLELLRQALPHGSRGDRIRFLDVGAGMGFSVDIARSFGWDAIGVEPSRRGQVGAELFGVPILSQFLEQTELPRHSFQAVLSSEVIEHVSDPDAFLGTLMDYLSPNGVLLLTTPNAAAITDSREAEDEIIESLCPGYHLTIFSAAGIHSLLVRQGLAEVRITQTAGMSGKKRLLVLAARKGVHLPDKIETLYARAAAGPVTTDYLEALVRRGDALDKPNNLHWAAAYRLMENHVNRGEFQRALPLAQRMDEHLSAIGLDDSELLMWRVDSLKDYTRRAPCFLGHYKYYRGALALNHGNDWQTAATCFRVAAHLCAMEEKFPDAGYLGHTSLLAKLHEGIALSRGGQRDAAVQIFDELLGLGDRLPDDIATKTRKERESVNATSQGATPAAVPSLEIVRRLIGSLPADLRQPMRQAFLTMAEETETIHGYLEAYGTHLETLSKGVAVSSNKATSSLQECMDRLDRISRHGRQVLPRLAKIGREGEAAVAALRSILEGISGMVAGAGWLARLPRRTWGYVLGMARCGKPFVSVDDAARLPRRRFGREVPLGEIVAGRVVEQEITCGENGLSRVRLKIGTHLRRNRCHLRVAVVDQQGNVLREAVRVMTVVRDNQFCDFHFAPLAETAGKKLLLRISSPDGESGNSVTVYARTVRRSAGLTCGGAIVRNAEVIAQLRYGAVAAPGGGPPAERDLLIVTPDRLAHNRIGLAMRHWEIASALSRQGLRVTLASTQPVPEDLCCAEFPIQGISADQRDGLPELARRHAAVMVQGSVLDAFPELRDAGRPMVADMITPMHIESIEVGEEPFYASLRAVTQCLEAADFFVCGNERQRLYWLGMLTAMGRLSKDDRDRDPEFRRLIDVVPFGIPDEEPCKTRPVLKGVRGGIGRDDFVLTWFGGIWNWLDPLPLIRAVHMAHASEPRIKLFFSMFRKAQEPPQEMAVKARNLCQELGALDRSVFFNELPIPFEGRADYLLESDLGVIVQAANFETQISARTRALDYLWADLPIFINEGDETAALVEKHGLGIVVRSNDPAELCSELLAYLRDGSRRQAAVAGIRKIKSQFRWKSAVAPLQQFCRSLRDAPAPGADA